MWQADITFGVSGLILAILWLIFQRRQRAASFAEVFVVTLASLLILGVTAAVLLLDLYASPRWQLTITRLSQLTQLSFFTVFVMNAVRKKEPAPKKLRLTFLVMLVTFLVLSYPWDPVYVIAVTLVALLVVIAIIRGPG